MAVKVHDILQIDCHSIVPVNTKKCKQEERTVGSTIETSKHMPSL